MTALGALYTGQIRTALGYSATWLPNTEVRIGDVGLIRNHRYERVSSLDDFGIDFEIRESAGSAVIQFATKDAVSIEVGGHLAAASAAPLNKGRIRVAFGAANAVLFQAGKCRISSIQDQQALGEQILALYDQARWSSEHVVVTELVKAASTTVLISASQNAEVEFSLGAKVELGATSLVDGDAEVRVAKVKEISTQIVAERGLTPLFTAHGVQKRFLRRRTFGSQRGIEAPRPAFARLDYNDFDSETATE